MHKSVLIKYLCGIGMVLALSGWALIQDLALYNWQLWREVPSLFPVLEFKDMGVVTANVVLILCASAYLITKREEIRPHEWWIGFLAMQIPYIYLKYLGIYLDKTQYLIAAAEGRQICCGAAMGHLLLGFYCMGPAAGLSLAAIGANRWLRKFR